eukprot:CAMPEP_0204899460 /NCGR_PEP_ID=MMETSP1397-20131031/1869_1 /ASSEMBLY_ACC=CAM_ASM_000891 /TAXON_ID=49980 /ORGANISM="Climacostomum Climacostomum virens, Strain Stock W-24" /LENGTH=330 /DNA_ID=CAMNT_0052067425 /DNA_START=59 /DNA_END=1051 /DNA_ORIENTATION=-
MDSKQPKPKAKVPTSQLQSTAASNKKLRRAPNPSSPYSSQANLSQMKKQIGKYNSSSPEHGLGTTESYKLLNKTFVLGKGDITDSSENSTKVSLALPGRSFVAETKRKPSSNERALQTKLDSIKTIEFNIYREVFNETIGQLTNFKQVLEEVKQGYDGRIASLEEMNAAQQTQIDNLQSILDEERRDKGVFQRRLKKLAQENYQLSVNCDELSEALQSSLNFSAKDDPSSESNRKELETMSLAMQQMEDKLQKAREKEQRLMKLLYIIKKRGVPIEEIYDNEVSSTNSSLDRPAKFSPSKPAIPKLELDSVDKEEDSEDFESDDDLFDSA